MSLLKVNYFTLDSLVLSKKVVWMSFKKLSNMGSTRQEKSKGVLEQNWLEIEKINVPSMLMKFILIKQLLIIILQLLILHNWESWCKKGLSLNKKWLLQRVSMLKRWLIMDSQERKNIKLCTLNSMEELLVYASCCKRLMLVGKNKHSLSQSGEN